MHSPKSHSSHFGSFSSRPNFIYLRESHDKKPKQWPLMDTPIKLIVTNIKGRREKIESSRNCDRTCLYARRSSWVVDKRYRTHHHSHSMCLPNKGRRRSCSHCLLVCRFGVDVVFYVLDENVTKQNVENVGLQKMWHQSGNQWICSSRSDAYRRHNVQRTNIVSESWLEFTLNATHCGWIWESTTVDLTECHALGHKYTHLEMRRNWRCDDSCVFIFMKIKHDNINVDRDYACRL